MDHPRDILKRLGLSPKHSWGQNFLSDDSVLERIAEQAMLRPGEACVELGPGLGHLTRHLLATGAKVTAVERDRDMVRALNAQKIEGLTLVEGNAAETDFAKVAGEDQVVVVGNLPYHLSSPILFEVLDQHAHVKRAVFTLQKEVVDRVAVEAGSRESGILTVMLSLHFDAICAFDVPAHFFHPPPKVDSAVLKLTRLPKPRAEVKDEARFRKVVKAGFAQRRKTLSNSLKTEKTLNAEWGPVLEKAGIDGQRRAETLSVEEFAAIERALD
jgi:16S rRNA (adenine1518-N6/adenine1519-N6)-dimethyltransferase